MPENRLIPYIGRELGNQPELRDALVRDTDNVDTQGWSASDMINFVMRAVREIRNMHPVERAAWVGGGAVGVTQAILTGSDPVTSFARGARTGREIANSQGYTPEAAAAQRTINALTPNPNSHQERANEYGEQQDMEYEDHQSMIQREIDISGEIMRGKSLSNLHYGKHI
jgi:hypothetical protein